MTPRSSPVTARGIYRQEEEAQDSKYKERLQNKYLKVPTNTLSKVNSCWSFVNVRSFDELNDSSPNLPGAQRGISPVHVPNITSNQTPQKGISKRHACFSKRMIQKQIRSEYVDSLEEKLTQHPLALYSHYKDHMSPELFDKVASVLDPDMCVSSSSALPTPALGHVEEEEVKNYTEPSKEEVYRTKQENPASKISTDVHNPSSTNPYVLKMSGNGSKKGRTIKVNHLSSNHNIQVAAKLFSKWFASKDDTKEINTESTLLGHFDSVFQDTLSTTFSIQEENASSFSSQE
ncbi:hypothetical protein PAMP_021939 [Pampus punctatissimus]